MVQFIVSYFDGTYLSMDEWPIQTPGPIRKIVYAFLIHTYEDFYLSSLLVPLTPVQTADADKEIQLASPRSVKIFTDEPSFYMPILFMLVEFELDYPGTKHAIAP